MAVLSKKGRSRDGRLKKGDQVQVITGAEKGKRGKILRVYGIGTGKPGGRLKGLHPGGGKVLVQGINLRYKHIGRSQKYPQGGRIQKEAPIRISNVLLFDAAHGGPVRTRAGWDKDGKKVRLSAKTGKPV